MSCNTLFRTDAIREPAMRLPPFALAIWTLVFVDPTAGQEPKPAERPPPNVHEISRPLSDFPTLPKAVAKKDDWPWWRGPGLNNHAPSKITIPALQAENIRWQVEIPGKGHASPLLVGEHVVLATAD